MVRKVKHITKVNAKSRIKTGTGSLPVYATEWNALIQEDNTLNIDAINGVSQSDEVTVGGLSIKGGSVQNRRSKFELFDDFIGISSYAITSESWIPLQGTNGSAVNFDIYSETECGVLQATTGDSGNANTPAENAVQLHSDKPLYLTQNPIIEVRWGTDASDSSNTEVDFFMGFTQALALQSINPVANSAHSVNDALGMMHSGEANTGKLVTASSGTVVSQNINLVNGTSDGGANWWTWRFEVTGGGTGCDIYYMNTGNSKWTKEGSYTFSTSAPPAGLYNPVVWINSSANNPSETNTVYLDYILISADRDAVTE